MSKQIIMATCIVIFARRDSTGAATRTRPLRESPAGRRNAAGSHGITRKQGQPVCRSMMRTPSSNSAGSPRSLLIRKPRDQRAILGVQHRRGPHQRRDHPAAVGLRLQQHRIELRPRRKAGRRACTASARPISPPSAHAAALFDMFCGLNGATRMPRRLAARHSAATMTDFPASEPPLYHYRPCAYARSLASRVDGQISLFRRTSRTRRDSITPMLQKELRSPVPNRTPPS